MVSWHDSGAKNYEIYVQKGLNSRIGMSRFMFQNARFERCQSIGIPVMLV